MRSRGEVVACDRCRESGSPAEGVGRRLGAVEIGGEGGQRDRRDVVTGVVERRPSLVVEGRTDQIEVVAPHGQVSTTVGVLAEGGGALEVALGAGCLDGVQGIGGVDGPVRPLDSLRRVFELGTRAGVEPVEFVLGGPERGEDGSGRADRLDVAVTREEQVPVRLLGHVVGVVEQGEEPAHRSGAQVDLLTSRVLLGHTDHQLEPRAGAHREDSGGTSEGGVGPHLATTGAEFSELPTVIAGQIDVPRRVDDRLGDRSYPPRTPTAGRTSPPGCRTGCR